MTICLQVPIFTGARRCQRKTVAGLDIKRSQVKSLKVSVDFEKLCQPDPF